LPVPVNISEFLELSKQYPVLDVRSPSEYAAGHIPGAHNLALFTDEERAIVGTAYKQVSRENAVNKGLEIFGPKMRLLAETAKKNHPGQKTFLVHCWRGGMRSGTVAWLLELYGYKVYLLRGGYKAFRRSALESFNKEVKINILGGRTGSGKTMILKELGRHGEQVIDLEGLAHHKGSSFGSLGEKPQPTQEMFENKLFMELNALDNNRTVWIEDESNMIGTKVIPKSFFLRMRSSPVYFLDIPFETRLDYLTQEYGKFSTEELKNAIERITKKLGGQHAKAALEAIDAGDFKTAFGICLAYYDKTYEYGKNKRVAESIVNCPFSILNLEQIVAAVIKVSR
jgi:tRNA 2-selenouridine synthase